MLTKYLPNCTKRWPQPPVLSVCPLSHLRALSETIPGPRSHIRRGEARGTRPAQAFGEYVMPFSNTDLGWLQHIVCIHIYSLWNKIWSNVWCTLRAYRSTFWTLLNKVCFVFWWFNSNRPPLFYLFKQKVCFVVYTTCVNIWRIVRSSKKCPLFSEEIRAAVSLLII